MGTLVRGLRIKDEDKVVIMLTRIGVISNKIKQWVDVLTLTLTFAP